MPMLRFLSLLATATLVAGSGMYLPGTAPLSYPDTTPVPLFMNLVESSSTALPYGYYHLPFCKQSKSAHLIGGQNLGSKLGGSGSVVEAPFEINMGNDVNCQIMCKHDLSLKETRKVVRLIKNSYRIHMQLDGLPVIVRSADSNYIERGYPVGFVLEGEYFLFNHVNINVLFSEEPLVFKGKRVVGFEVEPFSIKHKESNGKLDRCNAKNQPINERNNLMALPVVSSKIAKRSKKSGSTDLPVIFTYSVVFTPSSERWSTRWDVYLQGNPDDKVHYFSIVNSLLIVVFLSALVALILVRTVHKDLAAYNNINLDDEPEDENESGWKLVHADVFRPPTFSPMLLSVVVGTGVQIGIITFLVVIFAILGMTSPVSMGGTLTAAVMLYVFSASIAGYSSARLYKFFGGKHWKRNTVLTSLLFPGFLVTLFIGLDLFLIHQDAATAVSFLTIFSVFALWGLVSIPLTFAGSYFGFKSEKMAVPVKTNRIARAIPPLPFHVNPIFSVALGGILPFGSICIELFFIMSALWLHQIYYVFGFLLAVLVILCLTCCEIAILLCYFQLCSEDYRWWWPAFLNTSSSGLYLFIYSLWYMSSNVHLHDFTSVLCYVTYMGMISMAFSVFTGGIGFYSCFWFVKKIYGSVKVD